MHKSIIIYRNFRSATVRFLAASLQRGMPTVLAFRRNPFSLPYLRPSTHASEAEPESRDIQKQAIPRLDKMFNPLKDPLALLSSDIPL